MWRYEIIEPGDSKKRIDRFCPNRVKIRLIRVNEKLNPVTGFEKNLNLRHEQE